MPYCTKCGQSISDTNKFCTKCGHPLIKPVLQKPGSVLIVQKEEETGTQPEEIKEGENAGLSIPMTINNPDEQLISTETKEGFLTRNKKKSMLLVLIISSIGVLVLGYFLFIRKDINKNANNDISAHNSSEQKLNNDTTVLLSRVSKDSLNNSSENEQPQIKISDKPQQLNSNEQLRNNTEDTSSEKLMSILKEPSNTDNDKGFNDFIYLTSGQIKRDLINKPLCEGLTYTGENQKLIILGGLPDNIYQKKLDLLGGVTIRVLFKEETENKSCTLEVFYKKREKKFDLVTYAEK